MSEQNKTIVTRFFAELSNGRQLNVADELFSPAHIYHDPSNPGIAPGPQGMKDLLGIYHRGFPDAHWTVDAMYAVDDTVITRWTGRGTQDGALPGVPPTGKPVAVAGVWIHRIQGGKIVESSNVWDTLGMLRQLDAIPEMARSGAASAA